MRDCFALADKILEDESRLIELLMRMDSRRYYVVCGYKSLRTFCQRGLGFTKTQSQRLATEARRRRWAYSPPNYGDPDFNAYRKANGLRPEGD